MAYTKYKELTKYFNFNREIIIDDLPAYVMDYLYEDEVIFKAYKTSRDKAVFTNKRMVLFDVNAINHSKKIHIIPYKSVSSGAILFKFKSAAIFLSFDSGYQIKLNFVSLKSVDKTELRNLFTYMMKNIS